jgi:hypothetical protein
MCAALRLAAGAPALIYRDGSRSIRTIFVQELHSRALAFDFAVLSNADHMVKRELDHFTGSVQLAV